MARILVVEDEDSLREPLAFSLERDGFDVVEAADGEQALAAFEAAAEASGGGNDPGPIDLILLDLMLPGVSGTEVCRKVRKTSDVPVIMVTAKDDVVDRVVGLELGADDYVTKPYAYRELLARVRAVLRRGTSAGAGAAAADGAESPASAPADAPDVLAAGSIRMSPSRHEVHVDGRAVPMPLREFELLEYLMENVDHVLSRAQLMDRVWGLDYLGDTKTLDVHVKRLRSKIEPDPAHPVRLLTVRGLGYRLVSGS